MASSKYLHRSINLSCIIWVTTELCLERAEVAPGVCWAGPSNSWAVYRFPQCYTASVSCNPGCPFWLSLQRSWLHNLQRHEEIPAMHNLGNKGRQTVLAKVGWQEGARAWCAHQPCVQYAASKHVSPWQRLKVKEKQEKIDSECSGQSCRQRQNCLSIFFLFFAMWSSPCAVLKVHFVKPAVKSLYDLLLNSLQNCTIH